MYVQAGPVAVWLQLLERCATNSDCQPTVVCSLAQQLVEQRALTVQQQQQLLDLQQQMSAQQQLIAAQQQQLVTQQQIAAQQGRRIAALEQHLQQLLQRQP
jgi:hypothetical protein